jgi:hypothetical protein
MLFCTVSFISSLYRQLRGEIETITDEIGAEVLADVLKRWAGNDNNFQSGLEGSWKSGCLWSLHQNCLILENRQENKALRKTRKILF